MAAGMVCLFICFVLEGTQNMGGHHQNSTLKRAR